jgi:hypothetical protein
MKPARSRAFAAGLAGSLALILHNPVPHALFAIPWIIALATERERGRSFLALMFGYLPGLIVGWAWLVLRADIGSLHGAVRGITDGVFAWPNATMLNARLAALVKVWVWAPPGLLLIAVFGRLHHRGNRHAHLLMQSAVLTFAGYLFVQFDQGHGWGYRYFHSAWGAIPILAGCALTGGNRAGSGGSSNSDARTRMVSFAGAAAILNVLLVVPFQLLQISHAITQHLAQLPPPQRPGNNVYFIHPRGGFYVADMVQIDPLLRDPDLLLVSRGAQLDAELIWQNWPGAVQIRRGGAADQWYLGPEDRRVPIPGSRNQRHFVFASDH